MTKFYIESQKFSAIKEIKKSLKQNYYNKDFDRKFDKKKF